MVFHDLLHDRQSQSGSLRLMRYIRFGQPRTFFFWQADPVIADDDANLIGSLALSA